MHTKFSPVKSSIAANHQSVLVPPIHLETIQVTSTDSSASVMPVINIPYRWQSNLLQLGICFILPHDDEVFKI